MMIRLSVLFEAGFWIGVFEREEAQRVSASRVVFGSEPSSPELLAWLKSHYHQLEFSKITVSANATRAIKPKRAAREAQRSVLTRGVSSAAQDAMRLELESRKLKRRVTSKTARELEGERKFELRRAKQKARHRGVA